MHATVRTWRGRALVAAAAAVLALGVGAGTAAAVIPGTQPPGPTPQQARDVQEIPLTATSLLPESVAYDAKAQAFYASSENGGQITKGYLDGRAAEVFLPITPTRNEAVGITLDRQRRLYVAGGKSGKLHVYDVDTKAEKATFDLGLLGAGYLNDVTVDEQGCVYVTDSFLPRIYRWTPQQIAAGRGAPDVITTNPEVTTSPLGSNPPKPFNANGIRPTPDGKYLLFDDLNDAALYRMTIPPVGRPAERTITRVDVQGGSLGDADGLEFVGKQLYLADNGGERILKLATSKDYTTATIESATTSPAFHTPSGIAAIPGDRLLIANSRLFDPGLPFTAVGIARP